MHREDAIHDTAVLHLLAAKVQLAASQELGG